MNTEIKEFIEKNINLIEQRRFEELYDLAMTGTIRRELLVGELTETFLNADIDPAKYMKEIPSFYLYESDIQSYVIPNTINSIGPWAFASCSRLTNITIPNGVTSIDDSAFNSCTNLKSITYLGTKDQWNKIKLGRQRKTSSQRLKEIKCTDGTIIL